MIGAGSMGSGIAALLANAGIKVLLLDRPSAEGEDRNALSRRGVELQVERKGFLRPEFAERVTPGNIDDDAAGLGEVDWIIEAVFEEMGITTGIDLERLLDCVRMAESLIGRPLPGHILRAHPRSRLAKPPDLSEIVHFRQLQ